MNVNAPGSSVGDTGSSPAGSWGSTLLRFWMLRRTHVVPRDSPLGIVSLSFLAWLILWVFLDRWQRQPDPAFSADGVPLIAWYVLAVLALAALLRWRSTPSLSFWACVVLASGLVPVLLLVATCGTSLLQPLALSVAAVAAGLYAWFYLARGLAVLAGGPQRAKAALGVLFIGSVIVVSDATNAIPDVWNPQEPAFEAVEQDVATREAALFEQSLRIDQALESIQREPSPAAQGFFLGFAGVGNQKVFAQEIALAAQVLGRRYRISDREISLINDERNLDSAPLASVSGLDYALQGLASRMQLDRDVLFLAISSHGSSAPAIAVANSEFPLSDLTPEDLVDALQRARIQWRVIVISACYAGGFIEPLRDAHTIIITAAAADRTSFGCANDSDLTYFGTAFYRDELPRANSLRDAFERAKSAIAEREHAAGETPSNPQAYFGFDLDAHLVAPSPPHREAVIHLR